MANLKVAVLGAGGIVGQHMWESVPPGVEARFTRTEGHPRYDYFRWPDNYSFLYRMKPDVIVNLAGEARVDVVEKDPLKYQSVNEYMPPFLQKLCGHLIQVSTQGIFDGEQAPYSPYSIPLPITHYGHQKLRAEESIRKRYNANWTIARLTFVLGIRPNLSVGRVNPLEAMIRKPLQDQVDNRWFSPLFAEDAAFQLWKLVIEQPQKKVVHIGIPERYNRYEIAKMVNPCASIRPVHHEYFPGLAPRPRDTTWADSSLYSIDMNTGIQNAIRRFHEFDIA